MICMTRRWREIDSVLRRSQTTQKTHKFRHSRCGDKKGFVPGFVPSRDSRLPRIEIADLSRPRYGVLAMAGECLRCRGD